MRAARPERLLFGPGHEPLNAALQIDIDTDKFANGARKDSFATRDGVEHTVYTWAGDCSESHESVPQWVLDKVAKE